MTCNLNCVCLSGELDQLGGTHILRAVVVRPLGTDEGMGGYPVYLRISQTTFLGIDDICKF